MKKFAFETKLQAEQALQTATVAVDYCDCFTTLEMYQLLNRKDTPPPNEGWTKEEIYQANISEANGRFYLNIPDPVYIEPIYNPGRNGR